MKVSECIKNKPKEGKWYHKQGVYGVVYCSNCDYELSLNDTAYCPNCGSKMERSTDAPWER